MEAVAKLRYARISPRKVKIVLDLIRNKPVNVAMGILKNTPKSACEYLEKLLASAIANAENNHDMDKSVIAECGFLSNYEEAEKLTTKDYQKQVAHALCSGILAYLEASGG